MVKAVRLGLLGLLLVAVAGRARADTLSTVGNPSPASVFTVESDFVSGTGLTTDFRFLPDGRAIGPEVDPFTGKLAHHAR